LADGVGCGFGKWAIIILLTAASVLDALAGDDEVSTKGMRIGVSSGACVYMLVCYFGICSVVASEKGPIGCSGTQGLVLANSPCVDMNASEHAKLGEYVCTARSFPIFPTHPHLAP
jgi:hypothetical protein